MDMVDGAIVVVAVCCCCCCLVPDLDECNDDDNWLLLL